MKPHLNKKKLIQNFPSLSGFISECFRLNELEKLENLIFALEVKNGQNG